MSGQEDLFPDMGDKQQGRTCCPRALGHGDPDVISLRIGLADVLFLGGDHRRAAAELATLAADLAEREGPDHDLVLRFRLMEADSNAAAGETTLALRQLSSLLADEQHVEAEQDTGTAPVPETVREPGKPSPRCCPICGPATGRCIPP